MWRACVQWTLQALRIVRPSQRKFKVLDGMSGVLLPGRLTLLLGPPSCGKTTLLKALAGKLGTSALKVSAIVVAGNVTPGVDECLAQPLREITWQTAPLGTTQSIAADDALDFVIHLGTAKDVNAGGYV